MPACVVKPKLIASMRSAMVATEAVIIREIVDGIIEGFSDQSVLPENNTMGSAETRFT
jgi:hypothetical protein